MENSALNFFLLNKDILTGYIDKIKVNHEKTLVKYAYRKGYNFSMTVIIYGPLDETITSYEEKIKCIFNTDANLNELNEFIEGINLPYTFHFNPLIKISKDTEALTYAFNITAKFNKR